MINWIAGGIIFGLAILIVVRSVIKIRKGKGFCCDGCSASKCDSCPSHKMSQKQ